MPSPIVIRRTMHRNRCLDLVYTANDNISHALLGQRIMGTKGNTISDAMVERILREPKYISSKVNPRELSPSEKEGFLLKTVKLECDAFDCSMKIRQCVDRPSNFSVILVYKDSNKNDHAILRLNGNHGRHKNRIEGDVISGPHIHKMTERYQERTTHPDGYAEATDRYTDLGDAIDLFMEMTNIRYSDGKKNRRLEEFM